MSEPKSPLEYLNIVKRRKLSLVLSAVVVLLLFILLAIGLPSIYKSKALILIEEQEVPQEYVNSTIASFADQQVQVISQRVLTSTNIANIIEKFDLYQQNGFDSDIASTQLAKVFRRDMKMKLVSADAIDPRSGKPTEVTIAFTLSFKGPDPATTQQVVNELVTLFLNENVRERTLQATSTSEFLTAEADRLNEELLELEQRLADFKIQNEGSLPDQYSFNLSTLERATRELSNITLRIQDLEKRKIQLVAEMAQQSPTVPLVLPSGDVVLSDLDRLKSLQAEYRRKSAIYRNNHPDVTRLDREIKALEAELGAGADVGYLRLQLQEQTALLKELRGKYNDNYHEVLNTKRIIEQLRNSIADADSKAARDQTASAADNPTYIFLKTQLDTTESELRSLLERKRQLDEKSATYENLLKRGPGVERDYQALVRDYDNANAKYQEVRTKQRDATASKTLEQIQMGQRFILLEPPALPLKPISPNRRAIVFLGVVIAICVGLGVALVREGMDGAIYGIRQLTEIMGEPPLVAIPYIDNDEDRRRRQHAFGYSVLAATAAGIMVLVYLHYMLQPLDVIFFLVLNKLGLS
ncbi:MAG: hypothetical protein KDI16_12450 [Halioglobus sp.]|nr:hypothetical protein [Halioglobus sp.]